MTAQVQDTCGDGRTRRTSISKNVLQVRYVPSLAVGYPERTAVSLQVCLWSGLRPSAIRYYEQIGILPPAQRVSGQRRYDLTALHRLVVIQRARQTGFTLTEIKQLFFRFRAGTPPSVRWQKLKKQKIVELDAMLEHIQTMRDLLEQQGKCRCAALEECGKKIFEKQCEKGLS